MRSWRKVRGQGKGDEKVKVYELMSILSQVEAGKEVKAFVCLSPTELIQHGNRIDDDCFYLPIVINDVDPEDGNITLKI